MARANAARGPARVNTIMGVARSVSHPLQVALDRSEPWLKLAIPVLVAIFAVLLGLAGTLFLSASRQDTLEDARNDMDVIASLVTREITSNQDLMRGHKQALKIGDLHSVTFAFGRQIIITDISGQIIASEPQVRPGQNTLLDVLGATQPLTTFADKAGVIALPMATGAALATVRNLGAPLGQVAIVQPVSAALQTGQARSQLVIMLLGSSVLVLGVLTLAFLMQTGRARAADVDCDRVRQRIDAALNIGRCGLWDWNLARGTIYWSDSMYALLGFERNGEFLSFGEVNSLVHPDDADLYEVAKLLSSGERIDIAHDFRIRDAMGNWLWMRARAELVYDDSTSSRHLVGIAVDITEERRIAAASATADMRLWDAIETIPEAFVLWDAQQCLVTCNSRFQKLHQLPPETIRSGTHYDDVMAKATPPVIAEDIMHQQDPASRSRLSEVKLEDGRWLQISERRTKDGGSVSIGTDITQIKEHEHKLMDSERRLLGTITDLKASRRQMEAQAQQLTDLAERYLEQKADAEIASQVKTEFLANMSHDLRTPLNAIIGFSDVMQSGMFGTLGCERHEAYCRDIKSSGEHLLSIVDDILDMSRIETGKVRITPQRISLAPLVANEVASTKPSFEDKGISIEIDILDDIAALADVSALAQIIGNVLQNAAKFTHEGGEVSLRARPCRDMLHIFIADNGIGIPRERLNRIGRPFEQVEGGETARSHKGSGLGLAIARSLCELHTGTLRIRSQVGVGTVVMIRVPMAPAETPLIH
jgi:two-component system, cell cycle sensor histidine kinase PleC